MCRAPIIIDNPNYGAANIGYNFLKDCDNSKIAVPCGVCDQCIALKQMYMVQRVQMEATKNHIFFATLTYNQESLPHVSTSSGYDIAFADIRDLQLMFKRLRQDNAFGVPFRYFAVSEFGSLRGRPHFHILFMIKKKPSDTFSDCLSYERLLHDKVLQYWVRNYGSRRVPDYHNLCTYKEFFRQGKLHRNYDLHYVIPSLSDSGVCDVAFYVLKYMMKPSNRAIRLQQALHLNLPDDEYNDIWSLVRPRYLKSPFFGLNGSYANGRSVSLDEDIIRYLHGCVDRTPKEYGYPFYYNPDSGIHFPLGRFYRSNPKIYSLHDAVAFYYAKQDDLYFDDVYGDNRPYEEWKRFKKSVEIADQHSFDDIFTNL